MPPTHPRPYEGQECAATSLRESGHRATCPPEWSVFDERQGATLEWCWTAPVRSHRPVSRIQSAIRYISGIYLREPWWAEFWSGAIALGWAAVFFVSGVNIFDRVPLQLLSSISSGPIWAWFCLLVGTAQLTFLMLDRRCMRWLSALVMSWFPCMVVLSIALDVPVSPSVAVYGGWAGINLFSIFRLLRRAP